MSLRHIPRGVGRDLVQFVPAGRQPLRSHDGIASELEQLALGVRFCFDFLRLAHGRLFLLHVLSSDLFVIL
jgi:hypothetical protein